MAGDRYCTTCGKQVDKYDTVCGRCRYGAKHRFELYKLVPESLDHVREDAGEWRFLGDVPSEEIARANVARAGANGHVYEYLAW